MKKMLLVVTEDIAKIQTFTGKLGNLYSFFYQYFLKIKLNFLIKILNYKYDITILTTDKFSTKNALVLSYNEELNLDKTAKYKTLAWKITREILSAVQQADRNFSSFNSIPLMALWENKISVQLIYHYLSYLELLERLLSFKQYFLVLTLGNSVQEDIAGYLANKYKIHHQKYGLLRFNFINNGLKNYFRHREMQKKISNFQIQSQKQFIFKKSLNNPVLLSVDFFRHLKTLAPIYDKLQQLKANPLMITDEIAIETYLKNWQLITSNYVSLAGFITPIEIADHVKKWSAITKKINQKINPLFHRKPKSDEQLIFNLFHLEITPIVKYGLILSKLYLIAGNRLFKKLKPKHLIVAADIRLTELALSYLAKLYRIPSVTVSPRTMIFKEETYQYNLTDFIFVTGKHAQDQLLKLKVPARKIIVNGDPSYDHFSDQEKNFSAAQTFQKLGIKPTNKKIVLLISDRPSSLLPKEEKKDIFLITNTALKEHKNYFLVIKPHPTEKKSRLEEELKQWGIKNAVVSDNQKIELFDLLKISSVVIIAWSMTGLEAMMLRRPVIMLNPRHKDYKQYIPYTSDSVVEIHTADQLRQSLKIYTNYNHPKTRELINQGLKFSQYYIQKPDGLVTTRIAQHIIKSF